MVLFILIKMKKKKDKKPSERNEVDKKRFIISFYSVWKVLLFLFFGQYHLVTVLCFFIFAEEAQ